MPCELPTWYQSQLHGAATSWPSAPGHRPPPPRPTSGAEKHRYRLGTGNTQWQKSPWGVPHAKESRLPMSSPAYRGKMGTITSKYGKTAGEYTLLYMNHSRLSYKLGCAWGLETSQSRILSAKEKNLFIVNRKISHRKPPNPNKKEQPGEIPLT